MGDLMGWTMAPPVAGPGSGGPGPPGDPGLTPYIGANGNWWIGTQDTGQSARGPKGDAGTDGTGAPADLDSARLLATAVPLESFGWHAGTSPSTNAPLGIQSISDVVTHPYRVDPIELGPGTWEFTFWIYKGPANGIIDVILIDEAGVETLVGEVDCYRPTVSGALRHVLPGVVVSSRAKRLKLKNSHANPASSGTTVTFSAVHAIRTSTDTPDLDGPFTSVFDSTLVADAKYNSFNAYLPHSSGTEIEVHRVGDSHTTGTNGLAVMRKPPGGVWSVPTIIPETVVAGYEYVAAILSELSDGRVALATWRRAQPGTIRVPDGARAFFSSDVGLTFGGEVVLTDRAGIDKSSTESPIVEQGGNLYCAVYTHLAGQDDFHWVPTICRSTDDGATWHHHADIAAWDAMDRATETGIFYDPAAALMVAIARTDEPDGSWRMTAPAPFDVWSAPVECLPRGRFSGAPRTSMMDGKAYSLARDNAQSLAAVMIEHTAERSQAVLTLPRGAAGANSGRMLYGQVGKRGPGKLGMAHSIEKSSAAAEIHYVTANYGG